MSFLNKIKNLAGESVVYGLSGIFSRLIGFFLLPFFARTLSTADYGAIALLQSFFFLFSTVSFLGLDSAVFRWYYDSEDLNHKKGVFSTAILFQLAWSALLGLVLWLIGVFFLDVKLSAYPVHTLLLLLGFNLLGTILPNMFASWCRLQHRPWMAISIGLLNSVLSFAVSFLLVIVLRYGVVGYFAGQTAALFLTTLVSFVLLKDWVKPAWFDFSLLKSMIGYGINIVPASLGTTGMAFLANLILQHQTSQSELGLYQMGLTFALIITLITNAFAQAWSPFVYSVMKEPDHKALYNLTFQIYVAGLAVAALALAMFSKELIFFVASEKFLGAAAVAGFLTFGYLINSLGTIAMTGMGIARNVKLYSPAVLIGSALTLGLMLLLIPEYRLTGAALAFLLGQTFTPVFLFYQSHRLYPIPFKFLQPVLLLILAIVIFTVSTSFFQEITIRNFLLKLLVLLTFTGVVGLVYFPLVKKVITAVLPKKAVV